MTRQYVSDLATTTLSTGGPDLATGALSLTVVSNAGFPTSGSFFTVEAPTGEHITVTSGIGTTTWGGLIRGDNGTTAKIAAIPNGAILKEIFGMKDANNLVQVGDPGLTNVRSIKKTGAAALTGDVTLTGGTNVTLTQSGNDISIAATGGGGGGSGTVTSVGLSLPGIFTVTVSPITGSGTLTAVLANQSANTVLAGPTTGAAAAPTMRALVAADLPTSGVTAGTYGDATHVASFTVDAKGRIISASSPAITGGASSSPLTTKGDLYTHSSIDDRFPIGVDNAELVPDSTQATGLRWRTPTMAVVYNYQLADTTYRIGFGLSSDGRAFSRKLEPAITTGSGFEATGVKDPCLVDVDGVLYLYYAGYDSSVFKIGLAQSFDGGATWIKSASNPVLTTSQAWENNIENSVSFPSVLYDTTETDSTKRWKMWYGGGGGRGGIGYAYSADGISWTKYASNPVLAPTSGWESAAQLPGAIAKLGGVYTLFYNGKNAGAAWQSGAATFTDPQGTYTKNANNPLLPYDGVSSAVTTNIAVNNTTIHVADATQFPIGMGVLVFDDNGTTNLHYISTVTARPSSTTIVLADPAPQAISSATGKVWSTMAVCSFIRSALYDGGWRFGLVGFFAGLGPTHITLVETSLLGYSDTALTRIRADYSAGLIVKPTLAQTQASQASLENPCIVPLVDTERRFTGPASQADATVATTGLVEIDHVPSGAHPVAVTTAGYATSITALTDGNIDAAAAISLSKLGQSGATINQIATWNGTAWVPATTSSSTHAEPLTDGSSNFIFAHGDAISVVGVPN